MCVCVCPKLPATEVIGRSHLIQKGGARWRERLCRGESQDRLGDSEAALTGVGGAAGAASREKKLG